MATEFVEDTDLNRHELDLELGIGADVEEVKKQADLITEKWSTSSSKPENPSLLMVGGFQGSGKTTVLEILQPELDLLIISPDEIRYNLFAQNYPFSDNFVKLVSATKFELLKRALERGLNIAIDQALTPDRVNITREVLVKYPNYGLTTVFLSVPKEELVRRLTERPQLSGKYQGKVHELESIAFQKRTGDYYREMIC